MSNPQETKDFSEFITDLDRGQINQHITEKLSQIAEAVDEVGKKGELTIKFIIEKTGGRCVVACEVKAKVPEHPLLGTMFYFGNNGSLHRDDPKQLSLTNLARPSFKSVPDDDANN